MEPSHQEARLIESALDDDGRRRGIAGRYASRGTLLDIIARLVDRQDWCWEWRGRLNRTPVVELEGKQHQVRHVFWELFYKEAVLLARSSGRAKVKITIQGSSHVVVGWKHLLENLTGSVGFKLNDKLLPQGTIEIIADLEDDVAVRCLSVLSAATTQSPLAHLKGKGLRHRSDCPCDNPSTCLQASHLELFDVPKQHAVLSS